MSWKFWRRRLEGDDALDAMLADPEWQRAFKLRMRMNDDQLEAAHRDGKLVTMHVDHLEEEYREQDRQWRRRAVFSFAVGVVVGLGLAAAARLVVVVTN